MCANENLKFIVSFTKSDPPMQIDDDFECLNIPVDDQHRRTLYINKQIGVGYKQHEIPDRSTKIQN